MPAKKRSKYQAVVQTRPRGEKLYTDNRGVTAVYDAEPKEGNGFIISYPSGYTFADEDLPIKTKPHLKDGGSLPVLQALINKAVSLDDDPLSSVAHTFLTIGFELLAAKEAALAAANKVQYRDKEFTKVMHGVVACNLLDKTPTYGDLENVLDLITHAAVQFEGKDGLDESVLNYINELEKRNLPTKPVENLNNMET